MVSVVYAQFQNMPDDWYTPQRIELFYSLVAHAELFDEEAGQPDCLDPEKAKLDEKIEQIELAFKTKEDDEDDEDDYKGADHD
jgi:rubredoxin